MVGSKLLVDERIILKINLKEIWFEDVDWINLAQDRDSWWALVNTVISLLVP